MKKSNFTQNLKEITNPLTVQNQQSILISEATKTGRGYDTLETSTFSKRNMSLPSLHKCVRNAVNGSMDKKNMNDTTMTSDRTRTIDYKKYFENNQYLSLKSNSAFEKEFNLSRIISTSRGNSPEDKKNKRRIKKNALTSRSSVGLNESYYDAESIMRSLVLKKHKDNRLLTDVSYINKIDRRRQNDGFAIDCEMINKSFNKKNIKLGFASAILQSIVLPKFDMKTGKEIVDNTPNDDDYAFFELVEGIPRPVDFSQNLGAYIWIRCERKIFPCHIICDKQNQEFLYYVWFIKAESLSEYPKFNPKKIAQAKLSQIKGLVESRFDTELTGNYIKFNMPHVERDDEEEESGYDYILINVVPPKKCRCQFSMSFSINSMIQGKIFKYYIPFSPKHKLQLFKCDPTHMAAEVAKIKENRLKNVNEQLLKDNKTKAKHWNLEKSYLITKNSNNLVNRTEDAFQKMRTNRETVIYKHKRFLQRNLIWKEKARLETETMDKITMQFFKMYFWCIIFSTYKKLEVIKKLFRECKFRIIEKKMKARCATRMQIIVKFQMNIMSIPKHRNRKLVHGAQKLFCSLIYENVHEKAKIMTGSFMLSIIGPWKIKVFTLNYIQTIKNVQRKTMDTVKVKKTAIEEVDNLWSKELIKLVENIDEQNEMGIFYNLENLKYITPEIRLKVCENLVNRQILRYVDIKFYHMAKTGDKFPEHNNDNLQKTYGSINMEHSPLRNVNINNPYQESYNIIEESIRESLESMNQTMYKKATDVNKIEEFSVKDIGTKKEDLNIIIPSLLDTKQHSQQSIEEMSPQKYSQSLTKFQKQKSIAQSPEKKLKSNFKGQNLNIDEKSINGSTMITPRKKRLPLKKKESFNKNLIEIMKPPPKRESSAKKEQNERALLSNHRASRLIALDEISLLNRIEKHDEPKMLFNNAPRNYQYESNKIWEALEENQYSQVYKAAIDKAPELMEAKKVHEQKKIDAFNLAEKKPKKKKKVVKGGMKKKKGQTNSHTDNVSQTELSNINTISVGMKFEDIANKKFKCEIEPDTMQAIIITCLSIDNYNSTVDQPKYVMISYDPINPDKNPYRDNKDDNDTNHDTSQITMNELNENNRSQFDNPSQFNSPGMYTTEPPDDSVYQE